MTRFSLSDAPQELIDEIIDRCSRDKRTLIACSLISRVWVYRTRKHLFSTLTLTDKTLPIWCDTVVISPTVTVSEPQSTPNGPSSSPSHQLSSYVTSLQLVHKSSLTSPFYLYPDELILAKSHLSAFTHVVSLTFTAVSFLAFEDASLEACFGSLAKTVQELKLSRCSVGEESFSHLCGCSPASSRFKSMGMSGGIPHLLLGPEVWRGDDRRYVVRSQRQISLPRMTDYSSPSQRRKQSTTPSPSV
jgi:hypothetical protein